MPARSFPAPASCPADLQARSLEASSVGKREGQGQPSVDLGPQQGSYPKGHQLGAGPRGASPLQAVLLLRCLCPGNEHGASGPLPPQLWDLSCTPLACSENGAKSRPAQSQALGSTAGCGARLARCTVSTRETKGQPPVSLWGGHPPAGDHGPHPRQGFHHHSNLSISKHYDMLLTII